MASRKTQRKRSKRIRLPADVRPTEVSLHVEVHPQQSDQFRGEVTHKLRLGKRRSSLEFHCDGLRVSRVRAESAEGSVRGRVVTDPDREKIELQFPDRLPAGEVTVSMAFRGKLRTDLRGLYAARSGKRKYAFTQLEAAEARRFFPCLDEPGMKARFEVSVTTDGRNTVLSNSPAAKVEPLSGGMKTVFFEPTPPLSTYLLALAVGELETSAPTSCGDTEIRIWHVPGKKGLSDFGLEVARETLGRLENYFDLPYPYEKLDLVAVPDFEAGAMENAGAVFFRETLLLVDPHLATAQEKKRVAEVICHELAHMWYGDLVTMAWWDDLWLNEAFATWMAFHIVDAWKPEWRMWHDFQHYRQAALATDALRHSHPIYAAVRTPDEATENFDVITYEKGASVVRMLERYLGPEVFRAGVRVYIRRHRESNAVASDLWQALSEAAGFDVERIIRSWIEQEGFPLVRVRRKERDDGKTELHFRQERFSLGGRTDDDTRWPIPWIGRVGTKGSRSRTARKLITGGSGKIELESASPRFVYGNADESGFFRPLHHPDELARLATHVRSLSAVERLGLVGHQWAAVRAGHAPLPSFLDLAMAFGSEADPDVLIGLVPALSFVEDRVAGGEDIARAFRQQVRDVFGPALRELGLDRDSDDDLASLRRAALLDIVAQVGGDEEMIRTAAARCDAYLREPRSLDPNLADGIVHLAARDGDAALFERFSRAAADADTPQSRRRMLIAQTSFRDPELIKRSLADLLENVETQDVAILLARLVQNPAARETTWAFMKKRWKKLRKRMPAMLVTRPIDALPALGTRSYRKDVARFFRENPVPTGARAVRQALERFDLDIALVERAEPELTRWIRESGTGG